MNNIPALESFLAKVVPQHQGIFSLGDLKNLVSPPDAVTFYRLLKTLERNGSLKRFTRGFYTAGEFDLNTLSQRLCAKSYVSMGNVLAAAMVIGSIPKKTVSAVKIGKNRRYENDAGRVLHFGISPRLFFGYSAKDGIAFADKEKAFLDTLYFYQKGHKFSFNVYQDINVSLLDRDKVLQYLLPYRNPRFTAFVKGVLDA